MSEKLKDKETQNKGFFEEFLKKLKTSKKLQISIIAVAAVLVLFFGFAIYAASYDDILPGVTVNGVDVGGMSIEEAEAIIQSEIVDRVDGKTIVLKCGENSKTVSVHDLAPNGISANDIAMQAFAVGRENGWLLNTFTFIGSVFGSNDVEAVAQFDHTALNGIIDEISSEYVTDVKETEYFVENDKLVITKGKGGRCVNKEKATQMVGAALLDENITEVTLVVEDAEPKQVNVDEFYALITRPAQDASYKLEDGKIVICDEVHGVVVDKSKIQEALNSGNDRVEIAVSVQRASKTADDLAKMLFRDVMGEWSSSYASSSAARASNVELAASRMNGYILMPGEVFSYDQTIGERTSANGYKEAGVYIGNRSDVGIGGGICQPSSTLYGAVLYANLEIVERTSHSLPVSYVPAGQDATVAQGAIDFRFKNNTEYPVKIVATYSNRKLVCQILGVKPEGQTVEVVHSYTGTLYPTFEKVADASVPKGYKKTVSTGKTGATYSSKRIVKVNGTEVSSEKLTGSTYRATNTVVNLNPEDMGASPDALPEYTGQEIEENPEGEASENEEDDTEENEVSNDDETSVPADEPSENEEEADDTSVKKLD